MKYCRYCSYCIMGDVYYCTCYDKILKRIDKPTSCERFCESELGDVETGKKYTPRAVDPKHQITLQLTEEVLK